MRATYSGRVLLAAGVMGLGILGFIYHDFVRSWQPVPAGAALREPLVWISNLLLLICGAGLLVPRVTSAAALALALFLLSWIVVLHVPLVVVDPANVSLWGYMSGVLAVAAGALTIWSTLPVSSSAGWNGALARARTRMTARLLFAPTLMVFGVSHLMYAQGMTALVPAWLPFRTDIVYLTGCAHIAAGLGLLFGIRPRLAAILEAAMLSSFVLLVDVPRVAATLTRKPWTALCFETALVGAAWIVAGSLGSHVEGSARQFGDASLPRPSI